MNLKEELNITSKGLANAEHGMENWASLLVNLVDKSFLERSDTHNGDISIRSDCTTELTLEETPYINVGTNSRWKTDNEGIYKRSKDDTFILICKIPFFIWRELRAEDIDNCQTVIVYRYAEVWEERVIDNEILASKNKIVQLSKYGIDVNTGNATDLVKYIADMRLCNDFPIVKSVGKMGWSMDGYNNVFLPYDKRISLNVGGFKSLYDSVSCNGSFFGWYKMAADLRKHSIECRLVLAASFASVLIDKLGVLPFIVDFYGITGGGKTRLMKLCASVWGKPDEGKLLGGSVFTKNGLEFKADFLNSFPLIIDDLTSYEAAYKTENLKNIVYELANGEGKTRGNKDRGNDVTPTWRNCTIVTCEYPLSDKCSDPGAKNRIIDIPCSKRIFEKPGEVTSIIEESYGWAGKIFINYLYTQNLNKIKKELQPINENLIKLGASGKQALSGAVLLLADKLATDAIFQDGQQLQPGDIVGFLKDISELSPGQRAYDYLIGQLEVLEDHFTGAPGKNQYGFYNTFKDMGRCICINPSELTRILSAGQHSKTMFLQWCKENNLQKCSVSKNGKIRNDITINKHGGRWIVIKILEQEPEFEEVDAKEVPFN